MHKHITIEVGIDEDDTTTLVHATLDIRGDQFNATGRARRNPGDPAIPVIGEDSTSQISFSPSSLTTSRK